MNINPYLFFDGNCRQAFEFYAQCLGVELKAMLTAADTPMRDQAPAEGRDQIMHACIEVGDNVLMASDWNCGPNPAPFEKPRGFRLSLNVGSSDEAERCYQALAEGGSKDMPLEKTFFAERFGMLTDRFGIPWMINCEKNG
ncbi:MAG TPA: VOC family protein [Rhodanobacteraceae bacterium]|nr:VOC family protein [Rhodanobacteraceae bacterium]